MQRITYAISCETFGGFSGTLDVDIFYDTFENVCERVKNELEIVLKRNNFTELLRLLPTKKFHIHSVNSLEDLCSQQQHQAHTSSSSTTSRNSDILYICSHC